MINRIATLLMINYFVLLPLGTPFRLQVLSVGGNLLTEVPDSVGNLQQLQALTLCDNLIEILPASIARLTNLKSLLIHKNRLRHLPRDIITLKNLVEVSSACGTSHGPNVPCPALLIKFNVNINQSINHVFCFTFSLSLFLPVRCLV